MRCLVVLCGTLGILTALGCSSERRDTPPQTPEPAASPQPTATVVATPWNADSLSDDDFKVEEGFRSLSLADFETFFAKPPANGTTTWMTSHGAIVCFGKPKGYIYTQDSFRDFTLKLEFRFAPPADGLSKDFNPNTGVLVFIQEPHKQWPKSLEVQGKFAELASIKPNGGAAAVEFQENAAARESARKPVGEWNELEIESRAGALTAKLNGQTISQSQPGELMSGAIGLQSEDFEVHFRKLRIRAE